MVDEVRRTVSSAVVLGANTRLPNREMDRRRGNGDADGCSIPISPALAVHLSIRETGVRTENDGRR